MNQTCASEDICALCGITFDTQNSIVDEERCFCCAGCHAVYVVLQARQELTQGSQHPLFREAAQAGLISNPALLEQLRREQAKGTEWHKLYLELQGLWCPACCQVIAWILQRQQGIGRCSVDYATDTACVEYDPCSIGKDTICSVIQQLGYSAAPLDEGLPQTAEKGLVLRAVVTAFFTLNVMMLAYPLYAAYWDGDGEEYAALFAYLSLAATLPVITYGAWPLYRRFYAGLRSGFFGMETLVVISVVAATALSLYHLWQGESAVYFDSATAIIAFVLIGKVIESRAKLSARQTLMRLVRLQPRRGRKKYADGSLRYVSIGSLAIGDILQVKTGEKIILDGIVVEGQGSCDEALMTGEALPIDKQIGSCLVGGSVLLQGVICYRVTATAEMSVMQKIISMVEHDLEKNKDVSKPLLERAVAVFVPFIIVLALLAGVVAWFFGNTPAEVGIRILSTLLIACPCAIGIAIPLAEAHLMQRLIACGVLVRNRRCLRWLGKETLFVFDKTGTITHGYYAVLDGLDKLSIQQRRALKTIALVSNHPVAQAVVRAIDEPCVDGVRGQEFPSLGMRGIVDGVEYHLGSVAFLTGQGIQVPATPQQRAMCAGNPLSLVWVAVAGHVVTALSLGDNIRPDAAKVVAALQSASSVLLSGDSDAAVAAVAAACSFDRYYSCQSPLEKREYMHQQRSNGAVVAMVGDGINDAMALTAAHVGISVLSASDVSIQVSDLMLTTDDLTVLPQIRKLASYSRRIGMQNLFWTFIYNIIGLMLAVVGYMTPLYAAFAMVCSSIIVLVNAQRIVYWRAR